MATTDLGKWMITNGGEYNPDTTYEQLTMVLYQNSTYITLRTVTGIIPNNDKINYILMAQGFSANALADVVAKDTYGVIGDVSGDVSAQNLVDYLTNEVVNNLLKKTSISSVQTNSDNTVPSSSLAYVMQQAITKNKEDIATANSNLASIGTGTQLAVLSMDNKTMTGISFKNYKIIEIMVIIQQTSNGNMFFNFTLVPLVSHILNETRYIAIPGKSYGYCANVLLSINYSAGTVTLMEVDVNTGFTLNAIYILGLK